MLLLLAWPPLLPSAAEVLVNLMMIGYMELAWSKQASVAHLTPATVREAVDAVAAAANSPGIWSVFSH
jgi:hypothetical protein